MGEEEEVHLIQDKEIVIRFFKNKRIDAHNFPKKSNGKKPDFKLFVNEKLVGYCELKSIVKDNLIGERSDPTYNKIQNKIHEATKQFKACNLNHKSPNILFFINHHDRIDYRDLYYVLSGQDSSPTSPSEPIDLRYLKRLIKNQDLDVIDYIIWLNINDDKFLYYINGDSNFKEDLKNNISPKAYEKLNLGNNIKHNQIV